MTNAAVVILPVHNPADVLRRAIQGLLNQMLKDFELLAIIIQISRNGGR